MLSAESIRYSLAADFGLPDSTRLAFPMGPPEGTGAKTLGSSLGTSRNWLGNSLHRLKTTIGPVELVNSRTVMVNNSKSKGPRFLLSCHEPYGCRDNSRYRAVPAVGMLFDYGCFRIVWHGTKVTDPEKIERRCSNHPNQDASSRSPFAWSLPSRIRASL